MRTQFKERKGKRTVQP